MNYNTLLIEKQDNIGWIQFYRPQKLNALTREMLAEINATFEEFRNDKKIKIVIVTGSGEKSFIAGADIHQLMNYSQEDAILISKEANNQVFHTIENFPKPVIAAINGYALGGGLELALSCHLRIASNNATMGFPETSLGIIPGYGGTQRLPQLIGKAKAFELILSAKMISAKEALKIGLINKIVPQKKLLLETAKIGAEIVKNSPLAIKKSIACINAYYSKTENGYDKESISFASCFQSEDFKEGIQAFLKKKKANFKGE